MGWGWGITALRKDLQLLLPLNICLPTWPKYKIGPWFPPGLGELSWSCTDMLHTEADITRGRRTSHCWCRWGQGGVKHKSQPSPRPVLLGPCEVGGPTGPSKEPMLRIWKKQELEKERGGVSWSDFTCPSTSRSQGTGPTLFWGDKRKWISLVREWDFQWSGLAPEERIKYQGNGNWPRSSGVARG